MSCLRTDLLESRRGKGFFDPAKSIIHSMKDMESKVHNAMNQQCQNRGFAAPVDVLMDIGVLDKGKYNDWRTGRVPYLEAVCSSNLHKLSSMMKEIRSYAVKNGLKPSVSSYKYKGKPLRFSKTGNPKIEEAYATHYVMKAKAGNEKQPTDSADETT